jgi:gliding motility-associated-like protein
MLIFEKVHLNQNSHFIMIGKKLILLAGLVFIFCGTSNLNAQQNCIGIILNEYCASNVPGGTNPAKVDIDGHLNDWVEIKNEHSGPVSLAGYYLSNDPNNLYKWKFPAGFNLGVQGMKLVWLSGKNIVKNGEYHANFTLEQCRGQSLILTSPEGVIRDQVPIQPTLHGHTRGRVDCENIGIGAWRVFTAHSAESDNPTTNLYSGYVPTPKLYTDKSTNFSDPINPGLFNVESQIVYFKLDGLTHDAAFSCYDIFYTLDGSYPVPQYPVETLSGKTKFYLDSATSNFTIDRTTMVRFIAVPNPTDVGCPSDLLPSFCETNTYFIDAEHNQFHPNFGVISLAIEPTPQGDTAWFNSQGTYEPTVHVEYYDRTTPEAGASYRQFSEGYAKLYRPFNEEWRTSQKGFYVNIDDRLGVGCNFEGNIFNVEGLGVTTRTVFPQLHVKGGDVESNSGISGIVPPVTSGTGLRDVLMQSLAAKHDLHVSPLHIKPILTFVNGVYWGVYDLREIYDKYYENFYNKQSMDSLDLRFVHQSTEGSVTYWDKSFSRTPNADFNTEVYNIVKTKPMRNGTDYNTVMSRLDKASFIDYMILNSYANNSDLWANNIAVARGAQKDRPGYKWHFYLWNMPAIFNFTSIATNSTMINNSALSPCYIHNGPDYQLTTPNALNSAGMMLKRLMNSSVGNPGFQQEYKNRYQDLLNGPLKCDNIMKQYEYIVELFKKEMYFHEDPASPGLAPPRFSTTVGSFDSTTTWLREDLLERCDYVANAFNKASNCYGLTGPYALSVNVEPEGAGKVKLNTTVLSEYIWYGNYYSSQISFAAIPTSTDYVFHHWEFKNHTPKDPLSRDSLAINLNQPDDVVAVFTDKKRDISGSNLPNAFSPNGDGQNDVFRPLGSGEYSQEYQMLIFNRWGEQVFRSDDPQVGWDGYYKGQPAITGVYAFIINYKNPFNELKSFKGNVTLTR